MEPGWVSAYVPAPPGLNGFMTTERRKQASYSCPIGNPPTVVDSMEGLKVCPQDSLVSQVAVQPQTQVLRGVAPRRQVTGHPSTVLSCILTLS